VPVSITMPLSEARPRRHALGTAPAEVVRNARAFADLGVDTLIVSPTTSDPAEARAALEMLAHEVLPVVR